MNMAGKEKIVPKWRQEKRRFLYAALRFIRIRWRRNTAVRTAAGMRTGTAAGRSEGRRSFLIRISRRSAFSCASTAARKSASRKTTTCARSSAPSAARICTGNIPSGQSAGKRRRARSAAGTAARKWSSRIHTTGVPYSVPKPAASNGIPIKRKQKHKPASAGERRAFPDK